MCLCECWKGWEDAMVNVRVDGKKKGHLCREMRSRGLNFLGRLEGSLILGVC